MKNRWIVTILTIVAFIVVLSSIYDLEPMETKSIFHITVQENQTSEKIIPWMNAGGHLYVILPSYAKLASTRIVVTDNLEIRINGTIVSGEVECSSYQLDVPYTVTYSKFGKQYTAMLTFLKSDNVPTMHIDTESGNMDYVHSQKRNAEAGTLRLYDVSGEIQYDGVMKSIAGRGNTTWDNYEKKPYTVDLGEDRALLGMGAARDWVLLANATDPSNMRNKIVYDFAERAGLPYSPESRWIDLYLNGEYVGLYLLAEQNEVQSQRIAIEGEDSFLVTLESRGRMVTQNLPYIETERNQALRVRYPKNPTEEQLEELTKLWNKIEKAIVEETGNGNEENPQWTSLIDLDSWVRKYLIEEIFGSLDACFKSQFFFYDGNMANARVMAGPVWDFDLALGRTWHTESLDFLWANRLRVDDQYETPWFHTLYNSPVFEARLKELFEQDMLPLMNELCEEVVNTYHNEIKQAARINQIRWDAEVYEDDVKLVQDYLERRVKFLTKLWIEGCEIHLITAKSEGSSYAYFAVEDGKTLPHLPTLENTETRTFQGWYMEDSAPFDITKPIYEDICIYAKWAGASSKASIYLQYLLPIAVISLMGGLILFADVLCIKKMSTIRNHQK